MKKEKLIQYEDALLKKERGIKLGNIALNLLAALCAVPAIQALWLSAQNPDDKILMRSFTDIFSLTIKVVIFLAILTAMNKNLLKHIASIKLYRNESPNQSIERDEVKAPKI